MIDHDGEHGESSQSVKLRLIKLPRSIPCQALPRREGVCPSRFDTAARPVTNPAHLVVTPVRTIRYDFLSVIFHGPVAESTLPVTLRRDPLFTGTANERLTQDTYLPANPRHQTMVMTEPYITGGFFSELKRRNVYKVAIAYAVVAWLLIQIATQTFPFFEIPSWMVRAVIVFLVLGFPVALLLAWAFELTPEGIKRTDEIGRGQRSQNRTWTSALFRTCITPQEKQTHRERAGYDHNANASSWRRNRSRSCRSLT
jgi:hypothetical protein